MLLDVLGVKIAKGQTSDLAEPASNGKPLFRENYRITVEDIEEAMDFGGINQLEPGDAVMFRTGWNQLLARRDPGDIERWEASSGLPGPYLRESRWLAQFRPAVVASDTWALEVVGSDDNPAVCRRRDGREHATGRARPPAALNPDPPQAHFAVRHTPPWPTWMSAGSICTPCTCTVATWTAT